MGREKIQMMTRIIILGIAGILGGTAVAGSALANESATFTASGFTLADTRGKERRDDRDDNRDDRRDCRQEEGRVGDDKRDCKQDNRGDNEGDA